MSGIQVMRALVLLLGTLSLFGVISPLISSRDAPQPPRRKRVQQQSVQRPSASTLRPGSSGLFQRVGRQGRPTTRQSLWRDVASWLAGRPGASHPSWGQIQRRHSTSLAEIRRHQELFESTFRPGALGIAATLPDNIASVFYPFSGPDIASARALFPRAEHFLLAGLNPAGGPNLTSLAEARNEQLLGQTLDAIGALFRRSSGGQFMFQESMRALGTTIGVGMAAPLLSALGRSQRDHQVNTVGMLLHNDSGSGSGWRGRSGVVTSGSEGLGPGVRIRLGSKKMSGPMYVDYWETNLYNEVACRQLEELVQRLPRPTALMLKSASYALFEAPAPVKPCLEALTAGSGATVIIQDDAGMPMDWIGGLLGRQTKKGTHHRGVGTWEVTPYGGYSAGATNSPYSQKGLQLLFDSHPGGPRPLGRMRYGYCPSYAPEERSVLFAQGAQQDADARREAEVRAGSLGKDELRGQGSGHSPGVCNVIVAVNKQSGADGRLSYRKLTG